jgi:hypothetical protein
LDVTVDQTIVEATVAGVNVGVTTAEQTVAVTTVDDAVTVNITEQPIAVTVVNDSDVTVAVTEHPVNVTVATTGPQGPSGDENLASPFNVNDMDDGATYLYVGLSDEDGAFYVKRVTQSSGTVRHATVLNNALVASYDDAWTGRAALTFGKYDQAF